MKIVKKISIAISLFALVGFVAFNVASMFLIGADMSIVNTITIPQTNLAGNDLVNWTVNDASRVFFVSVTGSGNNSGVDEANAMTGQQAYDNSQAGDWYWWKAGDYGEIHYELSGIPNNKDNPLSWVGYKDIPGDIVSLPYAGYNSDLDLSLIHI